MHRLHTMRLAVLFGVLWIITYRIQEALNTFTSHSRMCLGCLLSEFVIALPKVKNDDFIVVLVFYCEDSRMFQLVFPFIG